MSRIRLICFAAVLAAAASAGPVAAAPAPTPPPSTTSPAANASGPNNGDLTDADLAEHPTCDPADVSSLDDPAADSRSAADDASAAPGDDAATDDSPDVSGDEVVCEYDQVLTEDEGATKDGGTLRVSRRALLRQGTVQLGAATVDGAGTLTEDLYVTPASVKVPKRILAGHATKTVTKAGSVTLTVRLTAAAKHVIKASQKDLRIRVKTTTKARHAKAKTRAGVLLVTLR